MNWDSKEFAETLAAYRKAFSGTDTQFAAASKTAEIYCEPTGCKDESPAEDFFSYLSEELENIND